MGLLPAIRGKGYVLRDVRAVGREETNVGLSGGAFFRYDAWPLTLAFPTGTPGNHLRQDHREGRNHYSATFLEYL